MSRRLERIEDSLLLGLLNNYALAGIIPEEHDQESTWQNVIGQHPPIESAFKNILEEREESLLPGSGAKALTEDDILCNTNLQTANLFKKLNASYKEVMVNLETTNETKKTLEEALVKMEKAIQTIKDICVNFEGDILKTEAPFRDSVYKTTQDKINYLNSRKEQFEKERDDIGRKLNALRKLITTAISDLVKPEDVQKKMCPVCFDKEVNMVLVPCGHTYCNGCAELDRTRHAKCAQCRSQINARVKLYFTV